MTNEQLLLNAISSHNQSEKLEEYFLQGKLLTFMEWKKRGYTVKKGEKAILKTEIWKRVKSKNDEEGKDDKKYRFIMKKASFFSPDQVEKI